MNRLDSLWVSIRSSLWFVPTMMVAGSIALAILLVEADRRYHFQWADSYPLLFGAGAEGSRGMLSTIAGSMITVAGVTFSLTIAALVTASGQYTSRILRNFMRDRRNQVVLGAFVGIFTYCLVVLRTIRSGDEVTFVPSLAVFAGLLLALAGIGVLVFFIHHIATSIQASTIIARITRETFDAMDDMYPAPRQADATAPEPFSDAPGAVQAIVTSPSMGYVQGIDAKAILAIAKERRAVVRMAVLPGDFVAELSPLMEVASRSPLEAREVQALAAAVAIQGFRTIDQEFGFGIRQLVDIALKALSPGVNDTTTAVMCIDHLGAMLARLAGREMQTRLRLEDGSAALVLRGPAFADVLDAAFDEIRRNCTRDAMLIAHLVRAIARVAGHTSDASRRAGLAHHLDLVAGNADRSVDVGHDREKVWAEVKLALDALGVAASETCARLDRPPAREPPAADS